MIYHKWSLVGLMLWARYGLLRLRPWTTMDQVYAGYLESPGTKAYSLTGARELFSSFEDVKIETVLTHGDLFESGAGQRHRGHLLSLAQKVWPRRMLRKFAPRAGLFMLVRATK